MVDYLISQGTDVNAKDDNGGTLLHRAARCNDAAMVDYIYSQGVDVHVKDNEGKTALDLAMKEEAFCVEITMKDGNRDDRYWRKEIDNRREVIARLRQAMG
jgi:hypothetical protein